MIKGISLLKSICLGVVSFFILLFVENLTLTFSQMQNSSAMFFPVAVGFGVSIIFEVMRKASRKSEDLTRNQVEGAIVEDRPLNPN